MKCKKFLIPEDLIADFAGKLVEKELSNEIKGVNEDGEIEITVHYDSDQRFDVFELSEWWENLEFEEVEDEEGDY
jgi:hypothetical protein